MSEKELELMYGIGFNRSHWLDKLLIRKDYLENETDK